jgi:hypothetical protein
MRSPRLPSILRAAGVGRLGFFEAKFHRPNVAEVDRFASSLDAYRFFHPPLCPGAPPVERGAGPNWRESVGWKILLPLLVSLSSREDLRAVSRPER